MHIYPFALKKNKKERGKEQCINCKFEDYNNGSLQMDLGKEKY